jgi:hypothetical protein
LSWTHTSARPAATSGDSERRQARSRSRVFHETTATTTSGFAYPGRALTARGMLVRRTLPP